MSKQLWIVVWIASLFLLVGCGGQVEPAAPPQATPIPDEGRQQETIQVRLGEPFTLAEGQWGEFQVDENGPVDQPRAVYAEVIEDSRCPINVNCVWAGEAVVEVQFTVSDRVFPLQLSSAGASSPNSLDTVGYRITLLDVQPYPAEPGESLDYSVTLLVESFEAGAWEPGSTPEGQPVYLGQPFVVVSGGEAVRLWKSVPT
jgi:hypothetical protein